MQNKVFIVLSFLLALYCGTGLYKFSGLLMNLLFVACGLAFLRVQLQKYQQNGLESISVDAKKFIFFGIYICFLLGYCLRDSLIYTEHQFEVDEGIIRQYANLFRGLAGFIIVVMTFNDVKYSRTSIWLSPLCLIIILSGLFLESYGVISFNEDVHESGQYEMSAENKLLARPGGFMNANMTASLAILWFYVAFELPQRYSYILKLFVLILTVAVCLLTQSRAAILFFLIYLVYAVLVLRNKSLLISVLVGCVAIIVAAYLFDVDIVNALIEKLSSRGDSKESNAQERLGLIAYAFNAFFDSPIFGNGIFYVAKTEGHNVSSHNQILEILSSYGLVGFVIMCLIYWVFYHKNSFSYLILCIFPTLFFSHNFFENYAFQVALGFAYSLVSKGDERVSVGVD